MKNNHFFCIIRSSTHEAFYHLYDRINCRYYVGADTISSSYHDCTYQSFKQKKIDILIPINEMIFEKLLKTYYIELTSMSIEQNLKQLKLEEYMI
jgi:CRISPR/Cas system endoribonuclease Cas6 (RAMP superfamily)